MIDQGRKWSRNKTSRPRPSLVLDGSIAIAWCLPDEPEDDAQSVLDVLADDSALVPDLWHLEVANVLLIGKRRGRSTQTDTVQWLTFLAALNIKTDSEARHRAFGDIIHMARTHGLTAYDATYLELALRHGLPLASLDRKLLTVTDFGVVNTGIH